MIPDKDDEAWSWLVMTFVPDAPGRVELRRGLAEEWQSWVDPALREFPAYGPRRVRYGMVGYRSVELYDNLQRRAEPYSVGLRLYLDGSGLIVLGYPGGRGSRGVPDGVSAVFDEHLVGDVVNAMAVLLRHGVRASAIGNGELSAQLRCNAVPMVLARYRGHFPGVFEDTRPIPGSTPVARHSTVMGAASTPSRDTIATVRAILSDLVSAFGLPEPQQITRNDELVHNRFHRQWQDPMRTWAERAGVAVLESY